MVPARAGVVPCSVPDGTPSRGGPRACGGGPSRRRASTTRAVWSPRVRGWSRARAYPASARKRGPRACGGGPGDWAPPCQSQLWSPRVRGWSHVSGHEVVLALVVPARAGVVPGPGAPRVAGPCAPRACGGGPDYWCKGLSFGPCSPRVRGWSPHPAAGPANRPVFPARAGVVPGRSRSRSRTRRAPRAGGGGPVAASRSSAVARCSPRVLGWSPHFERWRSQVVVLPACAGVAPPPAHWPRARRCAPRACGDGPITSGGLGNRPRCSPRVREWSPRAHPARHPRGGATCARGRPLHTPARLHPAGRPSPPSRYVHPRPPSTRQHRRSRALWSPFMSRTTPPAR